MGSAKIAKIKCLQKIPVIQYGHWPFCVFRLKVPDVADHMEKHGVSWTLVATKWFICLFIDVLPIEVRAAGEKSSLYTLW